MIQAGVTFPVFRRALSYTPCIKRVPDFYPRYSVLLAACIALTDRSYPTRLFRLPGVVSGGTVNKKDVHGWNPASSLVLWR